MKKTKKSDVVLGLVFCFLISSPVYAWDDEFTHPALTKMAIKKI
jgi:hypothetical protein